MQQSPVERSDRVDSSDGFATITADIKCGQLVFLIKDHQGCFSLLTLDRSEDKSSDNYLDLFNRWLNSTSYNALTVMGAGELAKDETDPTSVQYFIDDQPLAFVTTFGHSGALPIYRISQPETLWWLTIFHHAISEKDPSIALQNQLAVCHLAKPKS